MSLHYLGKHEPRKLYFQWQSKLGIRRDNPHCRIEMKFRVVGGLQELVIRFEFHHQNRSSGFGAVGVEICPFSLMAIGLYKIVISHQIKEAIANGHEKLNKLMIAQTLLPAKNY